VMLAVWELQKCTRTSSDDLVVMRVFYKTLKEIGYDASLLLLLQQKSINGHGSNCFERDTAYRTMFVSLHPKKTLRNCMAGVRCVGVSKMYALLEHEHDPLFPFCKIHWICWTSCHFSSSSHKNWSRWGSMAVLQNRVLD
jgi:hypothetical protein